MKARVFAEVVICWGVGGVGKSDMRCGGDEFLLSLVIWSGLLRFSVALAGVFVEGCGSGMPDWWTSELQFWSWIFRLGVVFVWN